MNISSGSVKKDLLGIASKEKASVYAWFFKTGKGGYGEGDAFIGVTVPQQRVIAKKYSAQFMDRHAGEKPEKLNSGSFAWIQELLNDKIHECRLSALMILAYLYKHKKADRRLKESAYKLYLKNFKNINNWDLVDCSARDIVGGYLHEFGHGDVLATLSVWADSSHLWTRRISVIATHYFIGRGELGPTLFISKKLLGDRHDLIHKASGWMLREAGKKSEKALTRFLDEHHKRMPRTMLRYAIERLSPEQKARYMKR